MSARELEFHQPRADVLVLLLRSPLLHLLRDLPKHMQAADSDRSRAVSSRDLSLLAQLASARLNTILVPLMKHSLTIGDTAAKRLFEHIRAGASVHRGGDPALLDARGRRH